MERHQKASNGTNKHDLIRCVADVKRRQARTGRMLYYECARRTTKHPSNVYENINHLVPRNKHPSKRRHTVSASFSPESFATVQFEYNDVLKHPLTFPCLSPIRNAFCWQRTRNRFIFLARLPIRMSQRRSLPLLLCWLPNWTGEVVVSVAMLQHILSLRMCQYAICYWSHSHQQSYRQR